MTDRWEQLAQRDPLFVILAEHGEEHDGWEPEAFFETGKVEVRHAIDRLCEHGVTLDPAAKALDFGCGVGRLTLALTEHVGQVTGVDISPRMLQMGRSFAEDRDDVTYALNDAPNLNVFEDDSFDFVFTSKVLFHLKPEFQRASIAEFLRVVKPGGVAVFGASIFAPTKSAWRALHARYKTVRRRGLNKQWRFMAMRALGANPTWLYERFGWRPMMPMYTQDEAKLQAVVDASGAKTLAVDKTLRRHRMNATWYVRAK